MSIKLYKNEFLKNYNLKQFVVIVLLMAVVNIAGIFLFENVSMDDWRNYALEKKEEYMEYIDADDSEEITETFVEEIMLIDYSLEHDIPYGTTGMWNHLNRMIGLFGIITIIMVYINVKVFLNEYECNTWKNLFCTETKRNKIFVSKIVFCVLRIILYLAIYLLTGVICGMTLGMGHGMVELSVVDGQVIENNLAGQIVVSYGMAILQMLFYISTAVAAIMVVKEKKLVIILPVLIMIISNTFSQWFGEKVITEILPFKYLEKMSEISAENIVKGCVVLGCYSLVLLILAGTRFKKMEVESC